MAKKRTKKKPAGKPKPPAQTGEPAAKNKGGAPSKLTKETTAKIVLAISGGNFRYVAAKWAGIHEDTFDRWMKLGEADALAEEAAADDGRELAPSAFSEFYRAVLNAEQEAEIFALAKIREAGQKTDPKHLQWWLERKFPERWGRKFIQKEISGPGGKPLQVNVNDERITDSERAERIRKLLQSEATQ